VADAAAPPWKAVSLAPVPLLLTAMAGEWGEPGKRIEMTELEPGQIVERIRRPDGIAGDCDAYALTIVGDSMWPRFRPGRQVIVSPKAPVAIGDDVVVQLRSSRDTEQKVVRVLIKEMLRRTANFVELRQFNPDVSFRVEASEIAAIHKVMGEVF
jgi:phage repressor protein C with HTH and peptisase S24 domain